MFDARLCAQGHENLFDIRRNVAQGFNPAKADCDTASKAGHEVKRQRYPGHLAGLPSSRE
jgi:hypothetical protein